MPLATWYFDGAKNRHLQGGLCVARDEKFVARDEKFKVMKSSMLRVENISKAFGNAQVLSPVSLDFSPGSTTALLGPSGCGKSTLLRIIMGILQPDEGKIWLNGKMVTPQNLQQIRQQMGYMIQDGGLFPHLTIRQNVVLMAD